MKRVEAVAALTASREWAREKIRTNSEPPWAWYRYMQLIDATTAILDGMKATRPKDHIKVVEPM